MKTPGLACLPPISIAAAGCLLALAVMTASSPALAQGTEEERRACTPDVMRLCREFIPSVSGITQCLIDKRSELNPDCRLVMTPKPNPVRQVATASRKQAAAPKRAAPRPVAAAPRPVASEPGEVIRPPMSILPAATKAAPAKKKPKTATTAGTAVTAQNAAVAPANPARKKPAPKPEVAAPKAP